MKIFICIDKARKDEIYYWFSHKEEAENIISSNEEIIEVEI